MRRWFFAALVAICCLTGLSGLAAAESPGGQYTVEARLLPSIGVLECRQTITWVNDTGSALEAICLRVYANAYQRVETSPVGKGYIKPLSYGAAGFNPGGVRIAWIKVDGVTASWRYADEAETVFYVDADWAAGTARTVSMRYEVDIPACASRFGYASGHWALGNVFAQLAIWEDGAWREDSYGAVGDPFYHEAADWTVSVQAPPGYAVAASGTGVRHGRGQVYKGRGMRDFALVIGQYAGQAELIAGGVRVRAFAGSAGDAALGAELAARALECLGEWFGAYPWASLDVVAVDFPYGGMEYPGLVMIREQLFTPETVAELERTIVHEVAHQWFYALVGSDPVREPWLDEALASFAELLYQEAIYGADVAQGYVDGEIEPVLRGGAGAVSGGIEAFEGLGDYGEAVYRRGAGMLWALREALGHEGLMEALRVYVERYAFGIAGRADFEAVLADVSGVDWRAFLAAYLDE